MTTSQWDRNTLTATLNELRALGDDTTLVECKTAGQGMPHSIGESLSAFANMPDGGTIILGVDENAGFRITGVDQPAQLEKQIANFCRQTVSPSPQLSFDQVKADAETVLIVTVIPLLPSNKPALYKGTAYLRQADGDYAMNANDLRMISVSALNERERHDFDRQILDGTDVRQLDSQLLETYKRNARASSSRLHKLDDDELLLQLTNVVTDTGSLRLAGLYAMGFLPQATEPALGATAAVRLSRTDSSGRTRNLDHLEGPIPALLEDAMEWIRRNTDTVTGYDSRGHMEDRPEFPPSAIREVLANSFVHRDLGPSLDAGKRVEIRVTDEKLIIVSPGGLRGLSVAQLESPELTKAAVNQRVYEIAKLLETSDGRRIIEGEGGGIREILIALHEAGLRKPKFIDTGTTFKVLFPRMPRLAATDSRWLETLDVPLTALQEDVLVALHHGESYSFERLRREFSHYSEARRRSAMAELEDQGLVRISHDGFFLGAALGSAAHDVPSPSSTAAQPAGAEELGALGKNVLAVYSALSPTESKTINDLVQETALSINQVRYALDPLLSSNYATMEGRQGSRLTTYRRL